MSGCELRTNEELRDEKQSYLRCVVPSCLQRREAGISFHKFPDKNKDRARWWKWTHALKLMYTPSSTSKVCSKHFEISDFYPIRTSDQTKMVLKNNVVPKTIDLAIDTERQKKNKAREERVKARLTRSAEHEETEFERSDPMNVSLHEPKDVCIQVDTMDIDYLFLKRTRSVFQIKSEEQLTAWTGLQSFKILDVLTEAVELMPEKASLSRWDITIKNLIVLVMIKLKTGLSFRCISSLFEIAPKTSSKYFHDFVPVFADILRVAIPWPSNDMIKNDVPYHFEKHRNVRAILDCTEIPIQRSNCLHCRVLTYSHYKGKETAKYLVAVTPGGCVSYVSPGFVGKASDKFIFNATDMITLFDEGDAIMVDKGFSILREVTAKNMELVRPPILFQSQLSIEEAKNNVTIAGARVHVERGIQRLKNFKFLKEKIDFSLLYLLDDIFVIAAGIANLSAPILSDDRFISKQD